MLSIIGHVHEPKIISKKKKKLPLHVSHAELLANHLHCLAEKSPKHLSHPENNYTGYEHW
jgi:REP element-mobilizing transposase RayT